MEKRKAKMIVNESGSGSATFRATLPTKWIKDMDLGEDERKLKIPRPDEELLIIDFLQQTNRRSYSQFFSP